MGGLASGQVQSRPAIPAPEGAGLFERRRVDALDVDHLALHGPLDRRRERMRRIRRLLAVGARYGEPATASPNPRNLLRASKLSPTGTTARHPGALAS